MNASFARMRHLNGVKIEHDLQTSMRGADLIDSSRLQALTEVNGRLQRQLAAADAERRAAVDENRECHARALQRNAAHATQLQRQAEHLGLKESEKNKQLFDLRRQV